MAQVSGIAGGATGVAASVAPFSLWTLFLVFTKIGAVLFGGGYVLLAFLRSGLVAHLGWLSERQLLDAGDPGAGVHHGDLHRLRAGGRRGAAGAALSGVLLPRLRVNSAWLVLGGAVIGLVAQGGARGA